MGATSDGSGLILGTVTEREIFEGFFSKSFSPSLIISNTGSPPQGAVNFNTYYAYATPNAPCFTRGSLILTTQGYVKVENLNVGDELITEDGVRSINWIGRTKLRCGDAPWAHNITPIRIKKDALADGCPDVDLLVSPGHGIAFDLIGKFLVPAGCLLNHSTISQEAPEFVEYWHVELEQHSLIYSQNCLVESYIEQGNRHLFDADRITGPQFSIDPTDRAGLFERIDDGPILDAIRARVQKRAVASAWEIKAPNESIHLEVDGSRTEGISDGTSLRFLVPQNARSVVLKSPSFIPSSINPASRDHRPLGVKLFSINVDDGLTCRTFDADHPDFGEDFYPTENTETPQRWTTGAAEIPSSFYANTAGDFFLKIQLADRATQILQLRDTPSLTSRQAA